MCATQVKGLLMYPYGCLEQTTSSAYPLVFIDEAAAASFGMTPISREERAKRLDAAFARLSGMQQPKGGFGLWTAAAPMKPGSAPTSPAFCKTRATPASPCRRPCSSARMDALTEQFQRAPNFQTQPPKELKRDANGRLSDYREVEALRMAHQRFAEAAHAGYILAREQKAPLATLRTLHDSYRGNAQSPLPLLHLGLALKLMGDEARAKLAIDRRDENTVRPAARRCGRGLVG